MFIAIPASAADFLSELNEGENCSVSSVYGDYQAPKRLMAATTEVIEGDSAKSYAEIQRATWQWLMANAGNTSKLATMSLSESDLTAIGAIDCPMCDVLQAQQRRLQVGVSKVLGHQVDLNGANGKASHAGGSMTSVGDGVMWSTNIQSPSAAAMKLEINGFQLPKGAGLYVFNDYGEAFGPYQGMGPNGDGEFWTNSITGDNLRLAIYLPKETDKALGDAFMTIASVGHMGPRFRLARTIAPAEVGDKAFCSFNESCVENANCGSTHSSVNDARKAVAHMIYQSGGGYYICSGGLLADTDNGSVTPYFLTANHCISKGREAKSLEAVFDFDTPCGGNCDQYASNTSNYPIRTNGAALLSSNRTGDYTLMRLNQTPGGSRAYLGWNSNPVAFNNGTALYRVSHPSGAPLAYSEHTVDTSKGTCSSWPRGNWIYSQDEYGATEGGSSGSPVVNSAGEVVGQLSGGCGTNVNDTCDTVNNATVDGAFAGYFDSVSEWLDPDNGGNPGGGDETVSSVSVSLETRGRRTRAVATVVIVDGSGSPVANASVSGSFSGDISGSGNGSTDSNGVAVIRSGWTRSSVSSVQYCVDTVNGAAASGNTCS
ncbi:MAG: hypothetical protein DHS20C11_13500 [Lysobacteraceae bacterium]|nr:MAG: hypothetical protein DHS20C11_13500 [Xanthomonadaceae bacterium]